MRVRLSGAAGPAGDVVLHNVDPHASTPRALVARWAADLGIIAEPCTAVARADRAGADEVPLHDPGATLSAAGVADGGVVLVKLLAGAKLIMLRPSADKECLVALHGALGMANVLRGYNAVALRKVVDASSSPHQVAEVSSFGWLENGAAYAPVPRAPPAVRNVTLSRELLPPDANGAPHPPLVFAELTNSDLDWLLSGLRAAGVSTTRLPPCVLLCDVEELADGASYYFVPLFSSGGVGEIYTPRHIIGHNTNTIMAAGLEHEASECVRGIVSALHLGGDVVCMREKPSVWWERKRLQIDEVLLTVDGSCAYVVEAEDVLTESSGDDLQQRLDIIECVLHAPMPPPWRLYADVADAHNAQ